MINPTTGALILMSGAIVLIIFTLAYMFWCKNYAKHGRDYLSAILSESETDGFSGSDLIDLCRSCLNVPVHHLYPTPAEGFARLEIAALINACLHLDDQTTLSFGYYTDGPRRRHKDQAAHPALWVDFKDDKNHPLVLMASRDKLFVELPQAFYDRERNVQVVERIERKIVQEKFSH